MKVHHEFVVEVRQARSRPLLVLIGMKELIRNPAEFGVAAIIKLHISLGAVAIREMLDNAPPKLLHIPALVHHERSGLPHHVGADWAARNAEGGVPSNL